MSISKLGPRTRVRDVTRVGISTLVRRGRWYNPSTASPPSHDTSIQPVASNAAYKVGSDIRMFDIVTPDFQKIRKTKDVTNPMHKISTVYSSAPDVYAKTEYSGYSTIYGRVVREIQEIQGNPFVFFPRAPSSAPSWFLQDIQNASLECLQKASAQLHNVSFSGSVFIAEAVKTLKMIQRPLRLAAKLLNRIERRKARLIRNGTEPVAASAAAWLEYRYGWKPLIGDVSSLTSDLLPFKEAFSKTLVARSQVQLNYRTGRVATSRNIEYYLGLYGFSTLDCTASIRAGIRYKVADKSYSEYVNRTLGLGVAEIASTVWEVIPFSFVADWFVNLSDWIKVITPDPGISISSNWVSTSTTSIGTSTVEYLASDSSANGCSLGMVKGYINVSDQCHKTEKIRNVNLEVPLRPIMTTGVLSLNHSVDSIALVTSAICGKLASFKH